MNLKHRSFTTEFKEQIIEQVVYQSISVAQLSREHNIARPVIYRWIREYQRGKLSSPFLGRSSAKVQVSDLQTLVGKLMIENELLKKALKAVNEQAKPNAIISGNTEISLDQ